MESINSGDILTIVLAGGFIILILGLFVLWIAMLIDIFKHPNENRLLWLVLMVCFGTGGGVIYYFAVYRKRNKGKQIESLGEPPIPLDSYGINNNKIE